MRNVTAVLTAVVGWAVAIWLSVWVLFIGGISEIVAALGRNPVPSGPIAWGITRVVFCEVGLTVGYVATLAAVALWVDGVDKPGAGLSSRQVEHAWLRIRRGSP